MEEGGLHWREPCGRCCTCRLGLPLGCTAEGRLGRSCLDLLLCRHDEEEHEKHEGTSLRTEEEEKSLLSLRATMSMYVRDPLYPGGGAGGLHER